MLKEIIVKTQEQADSLTVYLYQQFPRNAQTAAITPPIETAARQADQPQHVQE